MAEESLYDLLGIGPDADDKAVYAAYVQAARTARDRRTELGQARQELLRNRLEHDVLYYFDAELDDETRESLGPPGEVDFLAPELLPVPDTGDMFGSTAAERAADIRPLPVAPVGLAAFPGPDPGLLPDLEPPL
ncbi:hypothetical protein [Yinghuangia soli]|uniref:Uncharacterized protein n=1 Tax=Yinghuangia soli TaxID=2908204 RepID=A0AA41U6X5_9ACTN|nr:hypothetical protein [Yinghuangia soli]MCF2531404.1 hypothetical protein [Yinghuangia soli]